MKTYKAEVNGKSITLEGFTDDVKESILDIVKAREWKTAMRLGQKKLVEPEHFEAMKDAVLAMTFVAQPCLRYIADPVGLKDIYKLMAKDADGKPITDEDAAAMIEASKDESSDLFMVVKLMCADALPKA